MKQSCLCLFAYVVVVNCPKQIFSVQLLSLFGRQPESLTSLWWVIVSYSLATFLPCYNESRPQGKFCPLCVSRINQRAQNSSYNLLSKHDIQASVLLVVSIPTCMKRPLQADMLIFQKHESVLLQVRQPEIILANSWTWDHAEIKPWVSSQRDRLQVQPASDTLFKNGWENLLNVLANLYILNYISPIKAISDVFELRMHFCKMRYLRSDINMWKLL